MSATDIIAKLEDGKEPLGVVGSPSSSFDVLIDITEVSEEGKLLGELVSFAVKEEGKGVLVLGQVAEIETKNRWHEEPSFKGIIKRHRKLPNLSGVADNRIAKINVQSSFVLTSNAAESHKLANSPSTGLPVYAVTNEVMQELMKNTQDLGDLICLGNAYDTAVKIPFWLKHFGKTSVNGAGDAYHIGIFGRTGSGKTTVAANMILGYARHCKHMSILILDPQEQFYEDDVLPGNAKFTEMLKNAGMQYQRYTVPDEIALPNDAKLFSDLLLEYGFVRKAFRIQTKEKRELMGESICEYFQGRKRNPNFSIGDEDGKAILMQMLNAFAEKEKYTSNVYASGGAQLKALRGRIAGMVNGEWSIDSEAKDKWDYVWGLFKTQDKKLLEDIVEEVVCNPNNTIVLNISGRQAVHGMESVQTLFIKLIEDAIKLKGAELYAQGKHANCLVVLDEAHRFITAHTYDEQIKDLTTSIIDAVRTTRKYGIGYMFITQTIESLDEEIRNQIRIFALGYGLTSGPEFRKIKDIINDEAGAKFYRSFIDPASNKKYPFMFYGPVSPLSFTGAPLFLEMHDVISDYET